MSYRALAVLVGALLSLELNCNATTMGAASFARGHTSPPIALRDVRRSPPNPPVARRATTAVG